MFIKHEPLPRYSWPRPWCRTLMREGLLCTHPPTRKGRVRARSVFNLRHQEAREQRQLIDYLDAQRVQQMKGGR